MKPIHLLLAASATILTALFAVPAGAQTPNSHQTGQAVAPGQADGEVRKIDKETGKITLRHGEIKHLEMPPMTMVFTVKDKSLLDKVKPGDKVRFVAVHENNQMIVTELQAR